MTRPEILFTIDEHWHRAQVSAGRPDGVIPEEWSAAKEQGIFPCCQHMPTVQRMLGIGFRVNRKALEALEELDRAQLLQLGTRLPQVFPDIANVLEVTRILQSMSSELDRTETLKLLRQYLGIEENFIPRISNLSAMWEGLNYPAEEITAIGNEADKLIKYNKILFANLGGAEGDLRVLGLWDWAQRPVVRIQVNPMSSDGIKVTPLYQYWGADTATREDELYRGYLEYYRSCAAGQ